MSIQAQCSGPCMLPLPHIARNHTAAMCLCAVRHKRTKALGVKARYYIFLLFCKKCRLVYTYAHYQCWVRSGMKQAIIISLCFWWQIFYTQSTYRKIFWVVFFNFSLSIDSSHRVIPSFTFQLAFVKMVKSHSLFPHGLFYMMFSLREHKHSWRVFGQVEGKLAEKDTNTGKLLWVFSSYRSSPSQFKISACVLSVLLCCWTLADRILYSTCTVSLFCPLFLSLTNQNTDRQTDRQTHTKAHTHTE